MVVMKPASAVSRRRPPGSPFTTAVAPPVEIYAVDDRVTHDRHGLGRIVSVETDEVAVVVDFGSSRMRVVRPFSQLTKL